MHTPMHWRTERGRHFHAHPLHAAFSLVASMLLAGLIVLVLDSGTLNKPLGVGSKVTFPKYPS